MLLTEVIYKHSRRLPEQAAREALSYIEFLEDRYGVTRSADADTEIRNVFSRRSPEG